MAHTTLGHIGEFQPDSEDWISYTERLQLYFVANGIDDRTRRKAILLSVCGPSTYQLIRDLLAPTAPTDKTFDELVSLVKKHQQPTPSFIVQRYMFNSRVQQPGETISVYLAQLRKMAQHCCYGETLEDMLRDRLVCGCGDKRLQYKFLADPELTFEKAVALAKSNETAERGMKDLSSNSGSVNLLNRSNRRQQWLLESCPPRPPTSGASQQPVPSPCYRCGAPHSPSTCKFKTSTCYYCKKQGHLASVCRRKIRDLESAPRNSGAPYNRHLEAATDDSGDIVHLLYYSTAKRSKPIEVAVTLSEAETTMEVDTGATLSVMSEETYKRLWDRDTRPPLQPSTTQLTTYTGENFFAHGVINVHVSYQHQHQQLQLLIVPGKGPLLLGRDWLQHIHLDWPSINLLRTDPNAHLQQVLAKYPTIFRDELGHIREVTATFHVADTTQQPRFFSSPTGSLLAADEGRNRTHPSTRQGGNFSSAVF